jgi:hypothetical protein
MILSGKLISLPTGRQALLGTLITWDPATLIHVSLEVITDENLY